MTSYIATREQPTWYLRFSGQLMTDPALRRMVSEELMAMSALEPVIDGLRRCLPDLDEATRTERYTMTRILMVQLFAEREGEIAAELAGADESWKRLSAGLIDALTGLWSAPVA